MTKRAKKWAAYSMAGLMLLSSMTAHAGLSDSLKGMFMTNATSPGAVNSQLRGGLVGGSLSLRAPIVATNIITFDPPRLSAGCGGIDMFGGSFSFINSEQLVKLFRAIAANAVGAAFMLAINIINAQLGGVIEKFQSIIQALNASMKNTCMFTNAVQKAMTDPGANLTNAEGIFSVVSNAAGYVQDYFSSFNKIFSDTDAKRKETAVYDDCVNRGSCPNPIWATIVTTDIGPIFKSGGAAGSRQSAIGTTETYEIIMSLLGTIVTQPTDYSGSSANLTPYAVGMTDTPNGANYVRPPLSIRDFRNGKSDGESTDENATALMKFKCTDGTAANQCTQISEVKLSYNGAVAYVNKMLFGSVDGATIKEDSIVDKIRSCSTANCGLSQEQQTFINMISPAVLGMMKKVQRQPGAMEAVASMLVEVMADEFALSIGRSVIKAVNKSQNGTKMMIPQNVEDNINQMNRELGEIEMARATRTEDIMLAMQYVETIHANNPAFGAIYKYRR